MKTIVPILILITALSWSNSSAQKNTGADYLNGQERTRWQVTLRPFCPPPADQGILPASAAYALCNALTIQRNIQRDTLDGLTFSASYLFNSLKKGKNCYQGLRLSDALQLLEKEGVCMSTFFPNSRYNCELPPPVPQKWLHRIEWARRLISPKDDAAVKLNAIRSSLDQSIPLVAVIAINLGFDALASASGEWRLAPLAATAPVQYEAFVVTGYDDRSQTLEVMASYGTHWGDGGFARIGYSDFVEVLKYVLVLNPGRFRW